LAGKTSLNQTLLQLNAAWAVACNDLLGWLWPTIRRLTHLPRLNVFDLHPATTLNFDPDKTNSISASITFDASPGNKAEQIFFASFAKIMQGRFVAV